jgi:pSer/pThr/pTyr-binding forkhead associated (FHA) protein
MAFLYQINSADSPVERWNVGEKPFVVGRGDQVDGFVDDDALSRSHFLIVREGKEFFLVDLDSSNGTLVNDRPVSALKLKADQIIRAGESTFRFSLAPAATARTVTAAAKPAAAS